MLAQRCLLYVMTTVYSSSGGTLEEHSRLHDALPGRTIRCSPQCRVKSKVEQFEIAVDCSKPGQTRSASWATPINREAGDWRMLIAHVSGPPRLQPELLPKLLLLLLVIIINSNVHNDTHYQALFAFSLFALKDEASLNLLRHILTSQSQLVNTPLQILLFFVQHLRLLWPANTLPTNPLYVFSNGFFISEWVSQEFLNGISAQKGYLVPYTAQTID